MSVLLVPISPHPRQTAPAHTVLVARLNRDDRSASLITFRKKLSALTDATFTAPSTFDTLDTFDIFDMCQASQDSKQTSGRLIVC
jgi:hypothetical protein